MILLCELIKEYKDQYCVEKVQVWKGEISTLTEIAKSQPTAGWANNAECS